MRREKNIITYTLIYAFIMVATFIIVSVVIEKFSDYKKDEVVRKYQDELQSFSKFIVDSLYLDSENITLIKENDGDTKSWLNDFISKKIIESKHYGVINEAIRNIQIIEENENENDNEEIVLFNLNPEYVDVYKTIEINDNEVLSHIIGNERNFVISVPVNVQDAANKINLLVVYSTVNCNSQINDISNISNSVRIIIFTLLLILLIVKYFAMSNAYNYDYLTGFYSKLHYKDEMKKLINKDKDANGVLFIISFKDISDFEMQNIEIIEEVLYEFSRVLNKTKNKNSVLARVSEQKLGYYVHSIDDYEVILNKLLADVEQFLREHSNFHNIQYYIGVALYPSQEKEVEALVNGGIYAIEKLKKEKKQYHLRNYRLYDSNSHADFIDRQYFYDEVEKIIHERRVYTVFQPIVDLKTGNIFGYEALSRPVSDLVPNIGMLLTLAAEMNIKADMEMLLIYVINKTAFLNKDKLKDKHLFINTNVTIKYGEKEIDKFKYIIERIVDNLVIELTEYDVIDFDVIEEKIDRLKKFGAKIAIDDFGSGYSNELALLNLKPDIVKVDIELIRNIHTDARKYDIVKNLVAYAKKNNIKVLAEGVEEKGELQAVIDLDVDYVQGYIFAKPDREILDKVFKISDYLK